MLSRHDRSDPKSKPTSTRAYDAGNKRAKNLCINIYNKRHVLQDCKIEMQLYHQVPVFTNYDLAVGASHVLQKIAKIISSCPPESIVESMGSIINKICHIRGGSKTSTNKQDVKDISDELIIQWNRPDISNCNSVVKQALINLHFKGGNWHFLTMDVHSKLHRVSKVVDRLNQPNQNFPSCYKLTSFWI